MSQGGADGDRAGQIARGEDVASRNRRTRSELENESEGAVVREGQRGNRTALRCSLLCAALPGPRRNSTQLGSASPSQPSPHATVATNANAFYVAAQGPRRRHGRGSSGAERTDQSCKLWKFNDYQRRASSQLPRLHVQMSADQMLQCQCRCQCQCQCHLHCNC